MRNTKKAARWVWVSIRARCTTLCDKVCQWLATGWWFSSGTPVSSKNKIDLTRYNWNIVESGVKHHQTNKPTDKNILLAAFLVFLICSVTSKNNFFLYMHEWKTTNLSQVTDKLYHIMLYTSPWSRLKLTTSVVIGTDCIGRCKSNYHKIKT
jgi:hypothetical protein